MRLRKVIVPAVLGIAAVPAVLLGQGLPGAKPPATGAPSVPPSVPQAATPNRSGLDLVTSEANQRGKLSPATEFNDGGQHFHDELGWYRFTIPADGTTQLDGTLRMFKFMAAGTQSFCFAVRTPLDAFAAFSPEQIQSELEVLVPSLEEGVKTGGRVVEKRAVFTLSPPSLPGQQAIRVLAWDVRESNGLRLAYIVLPHQKGLLTFACTGQSAEVRQEIIERFLRIGTGIRR